MAGHENHVGPLRFTDDPDTRPLLGFMSCAATPRWKDVLRRDPCSYCGQRDSDMTVDHVTAFSETPLRSRDAGLSENGAGACRTCNEYKGTEKLLTYIADNPLGRRLPRIIWREECEPPGRLFAQLYARKPTARWWTAFFSRLLTEPPMRQHQSGINVWRVLLSVKRQRHVLEVRAAVSPENVVTVYTMRWRLQP